MNNRHKFHILNFDFLFFIEELVREEVGIEELIQQVA